MQLAELGGCRLNLRHLNDCLELLSRVLVEIEGLRGGAHRGGHQHLGRRLLDL